MVGRNKRCKELVYLLLFGGAWARAMVFFFSRGKGYYTTGVGWSNGGD